MKTLLLCPLLPALLLNFSPPLHAQDAAPPAGATTPLSFDEEYRQAREKSWEGLTFSIDFEGKTQFHMGEILPLKLRFSRQQADGSMLEAREYDRSGRLNGTDFFRVDPAEGVVDPLDWVFREGPFIGGGLSRVPQIIGPKPQEISVTLNEHLRFERPGHYRMYVLSNRVYDPKNGSHSGGFGRTPRAVSDLIEFDILPGDEWAAQRLQELRPQLNAGNFEQWAQRRTRGPLPLPNGSHSEIVEKAMRELRFLDTPDSLREIVRRFAVTGLSGSSSLYFGLLGTRHRSLAIELLQGQIDAPQGEVSDQVLSILNRLMWVQTNPPPLPPYDAKDPAKIAAYRSVQTANEQTSARIRAANRARLERAVQGKRGIARATALYTLLESSPQANQSTFIGSKPLPLSQQTKNQARQLIAVWDDLPLDARDRLLRYRWPLVRDAGLLPVLRAMTAREAAFYGDDYTEKQWRGLLLRRLRQLAPSEGRRQTIAEMGRSTLRVPPEDLLDLPDATLPSLDETLMRRLESEADAYAAGAVRAQLLARYASPVLAPRVQKLYEQKSLNMAVEMRAALLSYLRRATPQSGTNLLSAALKSATNTTELLSQSAAWRMDAALEKLALSQLNSADYARAADAAKTLGYYGSATSEAALWARLEKWHRNLQGQKLTPPQQNFEEALWRALASMPGPQLQRDQMQRLHDWLVAPWSRRQIEEYGYLKDWTGRPKIVATPMSYSPPWYFGNHQIAYPNFAALTCKLSQFPRGTRFDFTVEGYDAAADSAPLRARTAAWMQQHGFQLKS